MSNITVSQLPRRAWMPDDAQSPNPKYKCATCGSKRVEGLISEWVYLGDFVDNHQQLCEFGAPSTSQSRVYPCFFKTSDGYCHNCNEKRALIRLED